MYQVGAIIYIWVVFDEAVSATSTATSTPSLQLNTGREADYGGPPVRYYQAEDSLIFKYTVQGGDTATGDLDYTSSSALNLNGETIKDSLGFGDAIIELPLPGSEGSLSYNKALQIST